MKILFCGDVVGRSGRDAILQYVPDLIKKHDIDFVTVNGENAAHGFGITPSICQDFYKVGVDVITTGNHIWGNRDILRSINNDERLLRPINYPQDAPGRGWTVCKTKSGKSVLVVNVMGRLFMDPLDDPFACVKKVFENYGLKQNCVSKMTMVDAAVVDIHAETTSEKMTMGHFCDGMASLVVGTHTHIPTADHRILPKGTAYQTDAGMCGDYDSVIGMKKEIPLLKFTKKVCFDRLSPALGVGTLCGVIVHTSDETGLASFIEPVRMGPNLSQT